MMGNEANGLLTTGSKMNEEIEKLLNTIEQLKHDIEILGIEDEEYDSDSVISKLEEIEEYYSTFIQE